eukprot:m.446070 g.446070  ORF g.446070 m.446070 type:complete len:84 (+) comp56864_c0_seq5:2032-2283(+)
MMSFLYSIQAADSSRAVFGCECARRQARLASELEGFLRWLLISAPSCAFLITFFHFSFLPSVMSQSHSACHSSLLAKTTRSKT